MDELPVASVASRSNEDSPSDRALRRGELVVVGIGIQWGGQTTLAAQQAIQRADKVFFAVSDPWAARFVRELNPRSVPLAYPRDGRSRSSIYAAMSKTILDAVAQGGRVCAVFYGSAAVFTRPAHRVVREARRSGHCARLLPAVSSLECMFADLGFDPADGGFQCFEAGQFVLRGKQPDPCAHLVLLQIALIGNPSAFSPAETTSRRAGLVELQTHLLATFPAHHEVVIYEASPHPLRPVRAERVPLRALAAVELSEISTLYVPPLEKPF